MTGINLKSSIKYSKVLAFPAPPLKGYLLKQFQVYGSVWWREVARKEIGAGLLVFKPTLKGTLASLPAAARRRSPPLAAYAAPSGIRPRLPLARNAQAVPSLQVLPWPGPPFGSHDKNQGFLSFWWKLKCHQTKCWSKISNSVQNIVFPY